MIIFAGQNGGGFGCSTFSDVWALSNANGLGSSPTWSNLSPSGGPPVGQYGASAVYDPMNNRMIVFGGAGSSGGTCAARNAVWMLSNANALSGIPVWTNIIAEGSPGAPFSRGFHSAVYDVTSSKMLIFGGNNEAITANDVWALSNASGLGGTPSWSQLSTIGGPPSARDAHGAIFDVVNQRMTIFGGDSGNNYFNDVWVLALNQNTRTIQALSASAAPGSSVVIPVQLNSQGDENALGFSLTYDPNILSNPQATLGVDASTASLNLNTSQTAQGRLGLAVALPATKKFDAGTRQIVNVTFTIAANAQAGATPIGFGDQPIAREVVNEAASVLPTSYTPGSVTVTPGYEADVSPRPNGNNNGTVTIADWVQAGRYAAGVDPVVPAGGPTAPMSGLLLAGGTESGLEPLVAEQQTFRAVRVGSGSIEPGQNGSLALELDAQGNENALGFSLNFDPAKLRFVSASLGDGANGAALNINTAQAANGRVGIALALQTNLTFAAGTRQFLIVAFAATANAGGATTVAIGDQPVGREIVDAAANGLSASWTAATVTIARTAATVSAASFNGDVLASEAIVAAFGGNLATSTKIADTLPLPTGLAGTTVKVKDSAGTERLAPLFFVAPTQINYLIPQGTATGAATVIITSGDGTVSSGKLTIATVSPGLFSADASGQGIAAATVLRIKADGSQSYEPVSHFDPVLNKVVATPIDLGPATDQVFLIMYGTGLRHRSALSATTAKLGGTACEVLYAGVQPDFVGLDQVNLLLLRSLAGRGEVEIMLSVDGIAANVVRVSIK